MVRGESRHYSPLVPRVRFATLFPSPQNKKILKFPQKNLRITRFYP